jgi:hypothetical protein
MSGPSRSLRARRKRPSRRAAKKGDEFASPHSLPLHRSGPHISTSLREKAGVHRSKIDRGMAEMGQGRQSGHPARNLRRTPVSRPAGEGRTRLFRAKALNRLRDSLLLGGERYPQEEIVGSERGALSEDRAVVDLIEHGAPMVRYT